MASKKRTHDQAIGKSGKDSHDHPERCLAILPYPAETTEQQIREHLTSLELGKIVSLSVKPTFSRFTGRPSGLRADVEFESEEQLRPALRKVRKIKFNGKALRPLLLSTPEVTESLVIRVVLATEVPDEKVKSAFPTAAEVFRIPYFNQFCYIARFESYEASAAALKAFSGSIDGQVPSEQVRFGKTRPPRPPKKAKTPQPQKKKKVEQPKAQPKKAEAKQAQPKKATEAKEAKKAQPQKTEAKKTQPKKNEAEKTDSKKPAAKEVQAKKPESKKAQPKKTEAKVAQTKKN